MPLDPEELFQHNDPQEPEQRGPSHTIHDDAPPRPEPEPQPEPPQAEPPQRDPRDDRIDALQSMVNSLILREQPRQQPYPQHQPQPQPRQEGWQQRDFMTKEDAVALLTTQDPATYLNRVLNQVGQSIYDPMQQELRRRDQYIAAMQYQQHQRTMAQEQHQLAQQNVQRFYTLHPDVQEFEFLVPQEAAALAQESHMNPVAFVNKTDTEIYGMLRERVLARVNAIRGGATAAQTAPQPAQRRGVPQRTTLERGSGTRPSSAPEPKDPSAKELKAMSRHLRAVR